MRRPRPNLGRWKPISARAIPSALPPPSLVETARNEIANELNRIAANGRAELARAEQAERDLVNQLNTQKTRQITASSSYVQLRDLERTASATRAIYESFLKRARETSEEQSSPIATSASSPRPSRPFSRSDRRAS